MYTLESVYYTDPCTRNTHILTDIPLSKIKILYPDGETDKNTYVVEESDRKREYSEVNLQEYKKLTEFISFLEKESYLYAVNTRDRDGLYGKWKIKINKKMYDHLIS